MFVFVWKSTADYDARAHAYMSEADAWEYMSDCSPKHWPDFIIEMNGEPTENSNFVMKPVVFVERMIGTTI